jgi:hypothetical protein
MSAPFLGGRVWDGISAGAGHRCDLLAGALVAGAVPPQSLTHLRSFDRVSVDAPSIEVDTTDGCDPGLDEIVAFLDA